MAQGSADLSKLKHFLLDLDGTIYLGPGTIPGAPGFVQHLRDTGRRFLFFTNNSSKEAESYARKLSAMGIPCTPDEVLTSGEATIRYLLSETPLRRVYIVGTPSFEQEAREAGLHLASEDPEAVVLAFDRTLTYAKIERACLLLRAGLPFFATNPDKVCPTDYGYIPDCGAMAALLFESSGRAPTFIGKPNVAMAQMGMQKLGGSPKTTAMIGDRTYTDMQMAYNAGITSILVLSGETRREDLSAIDRMPDFVFESVQDLHAALMAQPA
ncbi:MAG TPA: HAD-IIA family hydrolase [Candidatus Hydrogenedentes bacterium]|nr:HAD-IIA family hydrolase [Candidatus Hydrogenedentota bacterium]